MRTLAHLRFVIVRGLIAVVLLLAGPSISGGGSSMTPALAVAADHISSQRYVIFVDGLFSKGDASRPLNGDFSAIKDGLTALGLNRFIYFSYGSAVARQAGGRYCSAWAGPACRDEHGDHLSKFDGNPVYLESATKIPVDLQAKALNWLLTEVVASDPAAMIDLVTFSVGGIVAARWASLNGGTSPLAEHIHTIVLIDTPAGGLSAAKLIVDPHSRLYGAASYLRAYFGRDVLAALQVEAVPESVIGSLPDAARFFRVTSIQSSTDYLVNGAPVKVCAVVCFDITFGHGTQSWQATVHIIQHSVNLGGASIQPGRPFSLANVLDDIVLTHLIYGNHSVTRSNPATVAWVAEAVTVPAVPFSQGLQ